MVFGAKEPLFIVTNKTIYIICVLAWPYDYNNNNNSSSSNSRINLFIDTIVLRTRSSILKFNNVNNDTIRLLPVITTTTIKLTLYHIINSKNHC